MEKLMQYVWQHKLWNTSQMHTNDGRRIRVIDPGLPNTDAGPDFFNAKVEIDGELWVGNVEMHIRATDWHRHGHDRDRAYDSVILHVVEKDDAPVFRSNGEQIPQMVLACSPHFHDKYMHLVNNPSSTLPCAAMIKDIPQLKITEWVEALAFERLNEKVQRIFALYDTFCGSWQDICYVTIARSLGFGINNDAFEMLARRTPLPYAQAQRLDIPTRSVALWASRILRHAHTRNRRLLPAPCPRIPIPVRQVPATAHGGVHVEIIQGEATKFSVPPHSLACTNG